MNLMDLIALKLEIHSTDRVCYKICRKTGRIRKIIRRNGCRLEALTALAAANSKKLIRSSLP